MTVTAYRREPDTYQDSVRLMTVTRALQESAGVSWGAAVMATPANLAELATRGFRLPPASANDLILAVLADSEEHADSALESAQSSLAGPSGTTTTADIAPRAHTLREAMGSLPDANVALVSVPGPYAALEAHHALSAGLHVLLFSDGVSLEDEVSLKTRAEALGLLLMGPGAGTAVLGGLGLGFANVTSPGPVGVVAAAGTGAQEVMALLDNADTGVAAVIGVGGRDLSAAVRGRMTRQALSWLAARNDVEVLLLVTKPPDPDVLADIVTAAAGKPLVVAALGLDAAMRPGVQSARTLDQAVQLVLSQLGRAPLDVHADLEEMAQTAIQRLETRRTAVRGVFSGGSLCYEAMVVLSRRLGAVRSNTALNPEWALPAPGGSHVCIDAGEEEFTASRPHPMIDAAARVELMRAAGQDPAAAVLLFDVVLGYGAHDDPAGVLAPVVADLNGPVAVAHVLGTTADPQGLAEQQRKLRDAGCFIAPTGARAALLAAAIAARRPSIVTELP